MQNELTQIQTRPRKPQHVDFGRVLDQLTFGRTSAGINALGWVLFGLSLVIFLGQLLKAVDPQDEGQFLTYPWLIAHGWMPYRDIWMSYPPATYLLLVPFYKIGVMGLVAERSLGVIARVLYILLVNRAISGSWRRFSWLGTFTTFSLIFIASDTKPYPWLVALPVFLLALLEVRRRPLLAAGLFFLAGTFRFEFALAGLVALAVLTAMDRLSLPNVIGDGDPSYMVASGLKRKVLAIIILAVSITAFYGALDVITGGWAWRDIFVDQVVTVQRGRYVSLLPLPFGPLGVPVLFAMLVGPPLMIVAGMIYRRSDIAATNAAVLVLLPHFFQRVDASHLFSMSALVIPWVIICLSDLARKGGQNRAVRPVRTKAIGRGVQVFSRFSLGWLGISVGAWCSLLVIAYAVYLSPLSPLTGQPPSQFSSRVVSGKQTIIAWTVGEARDDQQVTTFLSRHASSSQRIFIVPASLTSSYTRTDFYYLFGLRPATRYMEVQPGVLTQKSVQHDVIRKLSGCTWVVLLHGGEWYGPAPHAHGSILEAYIRSHYVPVMHNPTYAVLERQAQNSRLPRA